MNAEFVNVCSLALSDNESSVFVFVDAWSYAAWHVLSLSMYFLSSVKCHWLGDRKGIQSMKMQESGSGNPKEFYTVEHPA